MDQLTLSAHVRTTPHMPRNKSAPISIRVRPDVKEAIERLAKADKRSLASYIEIILEEHIERTMKVREKAKPTDTKA
jgi:hypothetical protein